MSPHPIIIVGAGLAGLTLGRCLRQHGIAAVILEKTLSLPKNNYGITLHPWAFQPLLNILKVDEGLFRRKLAVDSERQGNGKVSGDILAPGVDADLGTFRCHRGRLESLLQEGQDIRWEHTVQDAATSSQGILLQLRDARSFGTGVLIGTDGVHSQIRKALDPKIELNVLPFVVLNGKRRFAKAEFQDFLTSKLQNGTITQSLQDNILLEISINDYTTEFFDISYNYSRPAREKDPLHRPDRPTSGATDIPEAFYEELGLLTDLQQPFDEVFDPAKVRRDRVLHWLMRSALGNQAEVEHLANQGIVLIGDAIHAMPILGGEGANHALKDGVDLARHIVDHGTGSFQAFIDARYETWKRGVEESETRLANMHGHGNVSI
ncbi:MAG: hypothetical protein Q9209_006018 [Squamulea sp. 1 TL-2023]